MPERLANRSEYRPAIATNPRSLDKGVANLAPGGPPVRLEGTRAIRPEAQACRNLISLSWSDPATKSLLDDAM
ncbi:MAG: hypothetical protein ABR507_12800, partial [Actinomycetota bacterium]